MKRKLAAFILAITLIPCVLPAGAYNSQNFTDVPRSFWAYEPIMEMADAGIINGTGNGMFSPSLTVTSAQFLTLVGRSVFPDITVGAGESWYAPYVEAAKNAGWLNGTMINSAHPIDNGISRYDMAVILSRAGETLGFVTEAVDVNEIKDYDQIPDHYRPFVETVYAQGLIKGNADGCFWGSNTMTRAEVAMVIWRMEKLKGSFSTSSDGNADNRLTSEQISAKCAPAVFYIDVYGFNGALSGSGSGFFISSDGLAVTNFHVAANSSLLVLTTHDGKKYSDVSIIDYDKENDLALLKVGGGPFPYLELDDSSAIKQGQTAYAIGSPLGLDNTMSTGIISNPARVLDGITYIQISVPTAPGSSGGALLNEQGKVIGVTSAGFDSVGDLNLAIPSNLISRLNRNSMDDLILWEEVFYPDSYKIYDFGAYSGVKQLSAEPYAYGWIYTYDAYDFYNGDGSLDDSELFAYTYYYYRKALLNNGFELDEEDSSEMFDVFVSDDEFVFLTITLGEVGTIEVMTYRVPQCYADAPTLPDLGWYTFLSPDIEGPLNGSYMYRYTWSDYYSADVFYTLLDLYFDLLEEEGYTCYDDSGSTVLYEGNGLSVVFLISETDIWVDAKPLDAIEPVTTPEPEKLPLESMAFPWYLYSYDGRTYLGKLTTNKYDSDSIWNEYGTYGNSYGLYTIWNKYGTYGSAYSTQSAFNEYAIHPPKVVDKYGDFLFYLTENKTFDNGFPLSALRQLLLDYGQ